MIDERTRHELFIAAEQALGRHQSETFMEMLPPVGWADVATKSDLAALEERIALRFETVDQRFDMVDLKFEAQSAHLLGELDRRFNQQTRTLFLSLAGLMISLTTILLTLR